MDFDFFTLFILVDFLFIIAGMVCMVILAMKHIKQRERDDASPVLVVEATLVKKRRERSPTRRMSSRRLRFYATFELENGDRQEFRISSDDYHAFVEGDVGRLTVQGTRYKNFDSVLMSNRPKLEGFEAVKDFVSKVIDDNYGS